MLKNIVYKNNKPPHKYKIFNSTFKITAKSSTHSKANDHRITIE